MSRSSRSYSGSQVLAGISDFGSPRSHSPGVVTVSTPTSPTSPLKRKHSQISTSMSAKTMANTSERSPSKLKGKALPYQLDFSSLPPFDPDSATDLPSPAPTEIIDIEGPDFVRTSKEYGVKVRDFAYEEPKEGVSAAREVWHNPFTSLLYHDMHIRRPFDPSFELSPKDLHRLLDTGLVSEEEAEKHWTPVDWQRLKVYRARPDGPYPYCVAMKRPRPSRDFRLAARLEYFGDPLPSDISDSDIYVPEDGPVVWEGDEATAEEMAQMAKRRKLDSEDRRRTAAKVKITAVSAVKRRPALVSRPKASSPPPSESQPFEYSQVSNPVFPTSEGSTGDADFQATPPASPTVLPGELPRSHTTTLARTSSSAAQPGNNTTSLPRRLARTQTFSVLLVR
ncbi:hypothetical protein BDY19DRAFT_962716 [Irpex rosettiformis]|uniref:Uncharacterized protein n=1 Tax=Irpex rosettiformis TaxID=378272 RepID=A0ACB8TVK5_9APHY|nr:hypothetical protein BDY19DRAFT_962716 [Irpex rosettiformis]